MMNSIDVFVIKGFTVEYSRFSRNTCDVIRVKFTQHPSVHSVHRVFIPKFKL